MRTAIIFGSTGLVGSHLLNLITQDETYTKIKLFVRSQLELKNKKIEIFITDFKDFSLIEKYLYGDDCYFCIGTTKKETPNKKEYLRIEYDLPVVIGKIAKTNKIKSFIYVSSLGSNQNSTYAYLKNKGKAEIKLKSYGFDKLTIIRPSLMLGNRKKFRLGEYLSQKIFTYLSLLFLGPFSKYKAIHSHQVAKSMLIITKSKLNEVCYDSNRLKTFN